MSNQPAITPTSDERTWAMIAHLSILINLFTGFFGPIAALVIYLLYKDRSRYVAYQSMQSFVIQLIGWVGFGFIIGSAWAIVGVLSVFIVGLCLIPFAILLSFLPAVITIYAVIAAVRTSQGEDFRYWAIGDWVRGTYTG
jgi:uncharacterized Tic20 family protein